MCTENLLRNQPHRVENYEQWPEFRLVELRQMGFSSDPFEMKTTVCLLEDRNRSVALPPRHRRFHSQSLMSLFRAARNILIVHYTPAILSQRLGWTVQDDAHVVTLSGLIADGGLIALVKTTSDRNRYWLEQADLHSNELCQIRFFDRTGVRLVTNEWRRAA